MTRYLLDSHVLFWALYEPHKLSDRVRSAIQDPDNALLVSHVSPWELADKAAKFRLPLADASPDSILQDVQAFATTMMPIALEDIMLSVKLPRHHNDPLDRLLIAQAMRLGATLLSKDGKFDEYDVPVLWK